MIWSTAFVFSVLIVLLAAKAFGWMGGMWLTADYIAGAVIGVGLGLVLNQVLAGSFGMDKTQIPMLGAAVVVAGTLLRTFTHKSTPHAGI
jgi:uncharacterized membrane protein